MCYIRHRCQQDSDLEDKAWHQLTEARDSRKNFRDLVGHVAIWWQIPDRMQIADIPVRLHICQSALGRRIASNP